MSETSEIPSNNIVNRLADRLRGIPQAIRSRLQTHQRNLQTPVETSTKPHMELSQPQKQPSTTYAVTQAPALSRQERRSAKKEAYKQWKSGQTKSPFSQGEAYSTIETQQPAEIRNIALETLAPQRQIIITSREIPWIDKASETINARLITLPTGEGFYLADFIRTDELNLEKTIVERDPKNSRIIEKLLLRYIPQFLSRDFQRWDIIQVQSAITSEKTYGIENNRLRIYFTTQPSQNIPLIITIAVCFKPRQRHVFNVITGESRKTTKMRSSV